MKVPEETVTTVVVAETATNRKQPLLMGGVLSSKDEKKMTASREIRQPRNRIGEVAGGTAAECAAVCCCCPCTVVHLIVLALYTVPTSLVKKALRKSKMKRLSGKKRKNKNSSASEKKNQWTAIPQIVKTVTSDESEGDEDTLELDSEMWKRFHGAGFWRSSSRREES